MRTGFRFAVVGLVYHFRTRGFFAKIISGAVFPIPVDQFCCIIYGCALSIVGRVGLYVSRRRVGVVGVSVCGLEWKGGSQVAGGQMR